MSGQTLQIYKCNGCNKEVDYPTKRRTCPNCNHTVFRPVAKKEE